MTKVFPLVASMALALVLAACGGASDASEPTATPGASELGLPTRLLGLDLVEEDISEKLQEVDASYFSSLSLFGFRADDEERTLRATLQVGRFNDLARPEDPAFIRRIVGQVGASVPEEIRLGDHPVFMSIGQSHYTFLWFSGEWMYVLTSRDDYPFFRTMLRRLVEGSQGS